MKIIVYILIFLSIAFSGFAQNLLTEDDFEEGGSWTVGTHWSIGKAADWTISSSSCYEGSYCIQCDVEPTGGTAACYMENNWSHGTWGSAIFYRAQMKFPSNFTGESTDANGGGNFGRMAVSGTSWITEWWTGSGGSWGNVHFYDTGTRSTGASRSLDNQWHEYAFLIQLPTSTSSEDGVLKVWKDQTEYTDGTASAVHTDIDFDELVGNFRFGNEWKGEVVGYATDFYIDKIQIYDGIPAGGGDTTPPSLYSSTISENGTTLTLVFSEIVQQGAGYNDSDWDIDCDVNGNDIPIAYSSGDGTNTHVYTISKTIYSGETCDIDFNGDANSLEDDAGNDLAAIVSDSVTNNSDQYRSKFTRAGGARIGF